MQISNCWNFAWLFVQVQGWWVWWDLLNQCSFLCFANFNIWCISGLPDEHSQLVPDQWRWCHLPGRVKTWFHCPVLLGSWLYYADGKPVCYEVRRDLQWHGWLAQGLSPGKMINTTEIQNKSVCDMWPIAGNRLWNVHRGAVTILRWNDIQPSFSSLLLQTELVDVGNWD